LGRGLTGTLGLAAVVGAQHVADNAERLLDRVQTGILDIAVMYTPHHGPGVEISPLFEEELIAVTTAQAKPPALSRRRTSTSMGARTLRRITTRLFRACAMRACTSSTVPPAFSYSAYAAHSTQSDTTRVAWALTPD
jgi:DNA-binding transcriptional LysR family regulator